MARLTAFAFEKLVVYQKSVDFADEICRKTEQFPRGFGFLADQLNRAALSIATNLAEGNGRFAKPDRRNFFGIARGSVQECVPLLELALRRGLLDENAHGMLKSRLEEIARMLSGLIKGLVHFAPPLIAWPMGLSREHQPAECWPIMRVFFFTSRRARRNDGWPLRRWWILASVRESPNGARFPRSQSPTAGSGSFFPRRSGALWGGGPLGHPRIVIRSVSEVTRDVLRQVTVHPLAHAAGYDGRMRDVKRTAGDRSVFRELADEGFA